MGTRKRKTHNASAPAAVLEPHYAKVVRAFSNDRAVTRETRKGFGSGALKANGRIFAMMTPRGEFVAKLPEKRVDELIAAGVGNHFEPGPGRVMKEWIATSGARTRWIELAHEAYLYVKRLRA